MSSTTLLSGKSEANSFYCVAHAKSVDSWLNKFVIAVAGSRSGIPFPAMVEVLIMEISMEVLREATLRLPRQVGGALSIVGVLVIGQAAVSAGFVSPITVVVVALSTIGSFATPAYNTAVSLRILRFPMILLAGMFGLYGVVVGLVLILNHMLALRYACATFIWQTLLGALCAVFSTRYERRPNSGTTLE